MDENKVMCTLMETVSSISSDSSTSNDSWSEWSSIASDDNWIHNNDNEDVLLFPLLKYLTSGNKRHRVEDYLLVIESWSDLEFKEHFRLSRKIAYQLIDELEVSDFIPKNCFGKPPITGKNKFFNILMVYI
ncbi:unnamed protein product [Lasius platythorax]|uniref:Uncharacterized protein n=1 Tax=Lasius platythorax TaxID=488582 RepID=A0AAV2MZ10_9HYME